MRPTLGELAPLCALCLDPLGRGALEVYRDPSAPGAGPRRRICRACAREVASALADERALEEAS